MNSNKLEILATLKTLLATFITRADVNLTFLNLLQDIRNNNEIEASVYRKTKFILTENRPNPHLYIYEEWWEPKDYDSPAKNIEAKVTWLQNIINKEEQETQEATSIS